MMKDEQQNRYIVHPVDGESISFYSIEQKKTVVEIKGVWPPLLYIIPAKPNLGAKHAKRRYVFGIKDSEAQKLFSC